MAVLPASKQGNSMQPQGTFCQISEKNSDFKEKGT